MTTCLLLVDGSSYLYRAYHALPPLQTRRGQPTGAIYGMVHMLRQLLAQHRPSHCAVVFDAPGGSFRQTLYPGYKAQRPAMPEALAAQLEPLFQVIAALGLAQLREAGVEADDVLASLAQQAQARAWPVIIASNDKDLAQLVNEQVQIYHPFEQKLLDAAGVLRKYGVRPEQMGDYLALVGDSSDNIPGVPQVGPKTAARWLAHYGSLDNLLAHEAELGGQVGANLRSHHPTVHLARQLVRLRTDLNLPDLEHLRPQAPDLEKLQHYYTELEFTTWLESPPPPPPSTEGRYETVTDPATWQVWLARFQAAPLLALDTETTSLDTHAAELVGLAFALEPGSGCYVPLAHTQAGIPVVGQLSRDQVLADLKPLLENPTCAKLGQNLKYDAEILANYQIELRGIQHDTLLAAYVLDSSLRHYDLDTLAKRELHYQTISYAEITEKGKRGFAEVGLAEATRYAAEDADLSYRLHTAFWPRLRAEPTLKQLYETLEIPLIPVLARMERHGILLDSAKLQQHSAELAVQLKTLEHQLYSVTGQPFNPASPKQLQAVLYEHLRLPVLEKTPKGQASTAESALQGLMDLHPVVPLLLEHRSLSKLKSTYTDRLPQQVSPQTGRVHTSFHQTGTSTGRLSSSDPNLQNIPVRSPEGRRIREAFIAPPGSVLLAADYSQIELRILAHWCADPALLAAFQNDQDVHRATAAEIFSTPPGAVSADQRRAAKAINFGLIYGMSAFGLARQLGISREAAQAYLQRYFERYPSVKNFMDQLRLQARQQGYVETLLGRRLYLPDLQARNAALRQAAERAAINAPMQGSAADFIKRAMLALDAWLQHSGSQARMLLQVHDELVLEVPESELATVSAQVRHLMEQVYPLRVPLRVEIGLGPNWDAAH